MPKPLAKDAALQMRKVISNLTQFGQFFEGGDACGTFVWLKKSKDQKVIDAMCIEFDKDEQTHEAAPALQTFAGVSGLGDGLDHMIETAKKTFSVERLTHRETSQELGAMISITDFGKKIAVRVDYN